MEKTSKYINTELTHIPLLILIVDDESLKVIYQNNFEDYHTINKNICEIIDDYDKLNNIEINKKIKLYGKDAILTKADADELSSVLFIKTLDASECSVFMNNLSNVLRGPLNGIIEMSMLLQDTIVNETQENYLNNLKNSSGEIMNIVDNILDYYKLKINKITLIKKPFYFKNLINSVHNIMSSQSKENNITMDYSLSNGIPDFVCGDYNRIQQIFINLYTNSIQYSGKGGKITTKISYINNSIEVVIEDSGNGIRDVKNIFIPYYKMYEPINDGGLGLGLPITKKLCNLMGGDIKLLETSNKGTSFYFNFNIDSYCDIKNSSRYILVIDPNIISRIDISDILINNNFIPCPCSTINEALVLIKSKLVFDTVLIDSKIDKISSISFIKKLKIIIPTIRVVSINEKKQDMYGDIFDFRLNTPLKSDELLRAIN